MVPRAVLEPACSGFQPDATPSQLPRGKRGLPAGFPSNRLRKVLGLNGFSAAHTQPSAVLRLAAEDALVIAQACAVVIRENHRHRLVVSFDLVPQVGIEPTPPTLQVGACVPSQLSRRTAVSGRNSP